MRRKIRETEDKIWTEWMRCKEWQQERILGTEYRPKSINKWSQELENNPNIKWKSKLN